MQYKLYQEKFVNSIAYITIMKIGPYRIGLPLTGHDCFDSITNHLRKSTIAYMMNISEKWFSKVYGEYKIKIDSNESLIFQVIHSLGLIYNYCEDELSNLYLGISASGGLSKGLGAFTRLRASFDICLFLIRNGYFIESAMIERQILEQIAWINYVQEYDTDDCMNIDASKTIKKLKDTFKDAGLLYGKLSKVLHFDINVLDNYYEDKDDGRYIILTSSKKSYKNLDNLFILIKYYIRLANILAKRIKSNDVQKYKSYMKKQGRNLSKINSTIKYREKNIIF
jgi:hypothetical protein